MRLTKLVNSFYELDEKAAYDVELKNLPAKAYYKLGQLEEILENHNIKTLEQLDDLLLYVKQIKDIEKDLGIDLITLFKALKNGIWSKGGYYRACCIENESYFIKSEDIRLGRTWYGEQKHQEDYDYYIEEEDQLCLFEMEFEDEQYVVRVKDYGKTWALTRQELED